MTNRPQKFLRSFAGFRLLALGACLAAAGSVLAQQPQAPAIPDDVIWEPAIEYAAAGAKTVNLMMDVVCPRTQSGRLPAVVCIHGGGFRAGTAGKAISRCASSWRSAATWPLPCAIGFHRAVWTYGAAEGLEVPVAAQRLENGNTVIGDSTRGRIIEVDPAGKVVWSYENPDIGNMRMRELSADGLGDKFDRCRSGGQGH